MLSRSFRSLAVVCFALFGALFLPSSLHAQSSAAAIDSVQRSTVSSQSALGPTIAPAGVSRLTNTNIPEGQLRATERVHAGSDVALMGAGAAALIVGLVIGGDAGTIVAIGGGLMGIVGLYRYLR
jgi:hypothetical protein